MQGNNEIANENYCTNEFNLCALEPIQMPTVSNDESHDDLIFVPPKANPFIDLTKSPIKKVKSSKSKENFDYSFDMIKSEDETDEEDIQYKLQGYLPPSWSLPKNRMIAITSQADITTDYIDNLFCVVPTVDLAEMFPEIDQRRVKRRRSSYHWNTPPRYSQLTKY